MTCRKTNLLHFMPGCLQSLSQISLRVFLPETLSRSCTHFSKLRPPRACFLATFAILFLGVTHMYWESHLNPSPYPCFLRTEHMNSSVGRLPPIDEGSTCPFPVVTSPSNCFNWSSLTAVGLSILLSRINTGTLSICSSTSN